MSRSVEVFQKKKTTNVFMSFPKHPFPNAKIFQIAFLTFIVYLIIHFLLLDNRILTIIMRNVKSDESIHTYYSIVSILPKA